MFAPAAEALLLAIGSCAGGSEAPADSASDTQPASPQTPTRCVNSRRLLLQPQ
jgi:hypothetical protein